MLRLPYFSAPLDLASFEGLETEACSLCGSRRARLQEYDASVRGPDVGVRRGAPRKGRACLECMRKGSLEHFHRVEWGELTAKGIQPGSVRHPYLLEDVGIVGERDRRLAGERALRKIPKSAVVELRRTPPFRAWQGANWLIHCDDFMTFIGVWTHADFRKHSERGGAASLFQAMLEGSSADLAYEDHFGHGVDSEVTFYAFQCRHCRKLRGSVDNA